nr:hypothetical protein [Corynebacterium striatum]
MTQLEDGNSQAEAFIDRLERLGLSVARPPRYPGLSFQHRPHCF